MHRFELQESVMPTSATGNSLSLSLLTCFGPNFSAFLTRRDRFFKILDVKTIETSKVAMALLCSTVVTFKV
jgi:hypothetical protein